MNGGGGGGATGAEDLISSHMQHNTTDKSWLYSFPCMRKSQSDLQIEFSYWDEPHSRVKYILAIFSSIAPMDTSLHNALTCRKKCHACVMDLANCPIPQLGTI